MQQLAKISLRFSTFRPTDLFKMAQVGLLAVLMYAGFSNPVSAVTFSPASGTAIPIKLTLFSEKIKNPDQFRVRFYGPQIPPTVSEVLLDVCQNRGYGEECAKTLVGMAWKESNFIARAIGDNGKARGFFQIHYRLHKVSLSCAQDLQCSANWTIDYLEQNGYPNSSMWAIQCHNGCGIRNGYAYSVQRHGKRLWAKEMGGRSVAIAPQK
jgi:hypothetical protein